MNHAHISSLHILESLLHAGQAARIEPDRYGFQGQGRNNLSNQFVVFLPVLVVLGVSGEVEGKDDVLVIIV
jgi:hypothetical protein